MHRTCTRVYNACTSGLCQPLALMTHVMSFLGCLSVNQPVVVQMHQHHHHGVNGLKKSLRVLNSLCTPLPACCLLPLFLCVHVSCTQSASERSSPLQQRDSVEAGVDISQLQLQGSAGDAAGSSGGLRGSGGNSSSSAAVANKLAAAGSSGDEVVSQSRASSQIRVKKFHKLLGEPLVGLCD